MIRYLFGHIKLAKNVKGVLLLSIFAIMFLNISVAMSAPSKEDLEKVEKSYQKYSNEHKRLEERANNLSKELKDVSQQMVKTAKEIQDYEENISLMEKALNKLQTNIEEKENKLKSSNDNMSVILAALENLAWKPTEALLAQPLSPVDTVRSAIILRETVPYIEDGAKSIRDDIEDITKKKKAVQQQFEKIASNKRKMEKEHENMKLLVRKKSKIRNKLELESKTYKKRATMLAHQAKDLRELFAKLEKVRKEKEEKRRKMEEENRKIASKLGKKTKLEKEFGEFGKAKGRLSFPARGEIIVKYGQKELMGVSSKGIKIATRNKAQVVSPYDGEVSFAGPFRGYGNLIIIEHGEGYHTLLAGLGNFNCEVGQELLAGEPVGQMPETSETKLYFELRRDSHPINPIPWMKK